MTKFPSVSGALPKLESGGSSPVSIQDQHTLMLDLNFIQSLGATTLNGAIAPDDTSILLTDSTGFVDGDIIGIFSPTGIFYFGGQIGAPVADVISLDTPIDKIFPDGSAVIRATNNMNVNGSGTIQIFQVGPVGGGTGLEIDITRIAGYMQDGTVMDDGKFGGVAALTKGIVLRHNNTVIDNKWNAKTNGELALICASDLNYTLKPPSGTSYGLRFRNSFAGPEKHGVTVRLLPGDTLELLIQDDLTGLEVFNMMAQGHVVTD